MSNDFRLDSEELALVLKKKPQTQLAFASMLKFFQSENRYPDNTQSVPAEMISVLAHQLRISETSIKNFQWNGRSSERFRNEIRESLGFRKAAVADGASLMLWLMKNHLENIPTLTQCRELAKQYLQQQKIELFAQKECDRYIKRANAQFEKEFFTKICTDLSEQTLQQFNKLISDTNDAENSDEENLKNNLIRMYHLKKDIGEARLKNVKTAILKIEYLKTLKLPHENLKKFDRKLLMKYYRRIMSEYSSHIREHEQLRQSAMMGIFCFIRSQFFIDNSADLLLQLIHRVKTNSESAIKKKILSEVTCVNGKFDILCKLSSIASEKPKGVIEKEIYPTVSQETLSDLSIELKSRGKWYQTELRNKMRSLYAHGHRTLLLTLLRAFEFCSNQPEEKPLLDAISFIIKNQNDLSAYENAIEKIPMEHIIQNDWQQIIKESQSGQHSVSIKKSEIKRIDHMTYEIMILDLLHDKLQCKSIWINGAHRYRNPDVDMPTDFDANEDYYFKLLDLPKNEKDFTTSLKNHLKDTLENLNTTIPTNEKVKIVQHKNGARFKVTPSAPQIEPKNILALHQEIQERWPNINLIDILKEVELRIGLTKHCRSNARFQKILYDVLRKRLLLCFYGIGSNIGLKRAGIANEFSSESELRYAKRRHINVENIRATIVDVINETIAIRDPSIWGEATTGVACDSKHISCWDQNLMTQYHTRYRKRGVMVYWHVDQKSLCIYSQLKTCLSSEVGSMLNGIIKHCTKMNLKKSYVDTHGQSTIGFGFSHCLHVDLLPRFKAINKQKLYVGDIKDKKKLSNLESVIAGSINWDKIEKSYKEVVKHIAAIKTGTVDADVLIKRFGQNNEDHPVYQALFEIGKAEKTIFLCRNFSDEKLRIEIHESQNVVERVNGIMHFIFFGKLGEITSNDKEEQELSIVCLHLLQACMVYINTLMIQKVLSEPKWRDRLTQEDKRALTPLLHSHINPYGLVSLDMNARLLIELLEKTSAEQRVEDEVEYFE